MNHLAGSSGRVRPQRLERDSGAVTEAERPLHERLSIFDRPQVESDVPPDPYASALIAAGCSIKAVQSALGHKNASETLYSHLFPFDEDRLRDAVQALHGPLPVGHVSRASGTTL
jgi:hypothetical protein